MQSIYEGGEMTEQRLGEIAFAVVTASVSDETNWKEVAIELLQEVRNRYTKEELDKAYQAGVIDGERVW